MAKPLQQHAAYAQFEAEFSGRLLTESSDEYSEARALHNSMIETRPALIAQCNDATAVAAAVRFARESGAEIAVRAGGHSVAGMSSVDGGLVIDVRPLKSISIDPQARRARVGGGVTWGEFDKAAQEHGLATTGGRVSTTGVAGFTLGGGSGWIERQFGLACDNLVSVDLVLASGDQVTASASEHADLFWALHGGGGNFGVATSFEFAMHPVGPTVLAGLMLWPGAAGPDVLEAFRAWADQTPENFGTAFVSLTGPPEEFVPAHLQGQPVCGLAACWNGPIEEGEHVVAPMRALHPEVDLVGPMPYADFQCMLDDPPGLRNYWGAEYLDELSDDAMAIYLKASSDMPSPISQNLLLPWGGAVARVTAAESPMTKRDARWIYHPFATWESSADDDANISWARAAGADMRRYASGGVYLNFIGDEGADRVRAAFGDENYSRLAEIKATYDPENLFRRNQNIKPAAR